MTETALTHARVVHRLKRRIRLISPIILKDTERAYILEILLKKHRAVQEVKTVPVIGSITINFEPELLSGENLLIMLNAILGNLGQYKRPSISTTEAIVSDIPEQTFHLTIEGMTCASCALLLEMLLKRDSRIRYATVNFATESATVTGHISQTVLFQVIERAGYKAQNLDNLAQRQLVIEHEKQHLKVAKWRAIIAGALSVPLMVISIGAPASQFWHWMQHLLAIPVVFWAGKPFFIKAAKLAKQRSTNMDSLIALGVGASYSYSLISLVTGKRGLYFDSAAGIITFVLIGRYLEEKAKGKAHEAITKLVNLQPQHATLLKEDVELIIDLEHVQINDILLIRPGEKIPTDGIVIEGKSTVDESIVTGESLPVAKKTGDVLVGGCINNNGILKMRVTAIGSDTVLSNIVHMVDQAQSSKLPIQQTVDKISSVFVPAVMLVSATTFIAWLSVGAGFRFALSNAIAVLLIACPCSLGLAIPMAIMVGTGQSAKRGVYIRNGSSLEMASKLDTIIFDKTGTITEGKPQVTDFIPLNQDEKLILTLAATAEKHSEHFLAKTIVTYAKKHKIRLKKIQEFDNIAGSGIKARIDDHAVLMGNARWFEELSMNLNGLDESARTLAKQGKTPVFFALDGQVVALFGIADLARPHAALAVERLQHLGVTPLMVTGDTEATAQHIAEQVGIQTVIAHAQPEHKLNIVHQLQAEGKKVGMIGDGINDAPALAAADVSFAIGTGTDVAIETAHLTLVNGDISKIADVIELSDASLRIIKQNLFWALGYNTIAIPVAAMGKLNPMIASAAMAMSSISVVLNSLRLQSK